jgi:hypothetical protein
MAFTNHKPETKLIISQKLKGRKLSQETKNKIANKMKKNKNNSNGTSGYRPTKWTLETKQLADTLCFFGFKIHRAEDNYLNATFIHNGGQFETHLEINGPTVRVILIKTGNKKTSFMNELIFNLEDVGLEFAVKQVMMTYQNMWVPVQTPYLNL